jgi:phytoene dehydrogenase-like protein
VWSDVEVVKILTHDCTGAVQGVQIRNRRSGESTCLRARLVVSNLGPEATQELLRRDGCTSASVLEPTRQLHKAAGVKLHVASDRSLIPHNGIMFCLGMRRISGMVEVSRAVPSVAPPGMHMINTFQVPGSDSLVEERELAIADLRDIFGQDFDRHCQIVRTSAFRSRWPVNQAIQGQDLRNQAPLPGLVMVGDAYKPSGHIMVEGVAASVARAFSNLEYGNSS